MSNFISFSPFSSDNLNQEYQKWHLRKPQLSKRAELMVTRPLEFLCDQIAFQAGGDPDLLSAVQLLQQTLCWQPVGTEYNARLELSELMKELERLVENQIENTDDPESAVPVDTLIRAGSSVFAAHFLYPGDGNKIYEVDNVLNDLTADFVQKVTPVDLAQIYLERRISQRIAKISI